MLVVLVLEDTYVGYAASAGSDFVPVLSALTTDCSTYLITVREEKSWASSTVYNSRSQNLFTWQMPPGFGQGCLVKVLT